MVVFYHAANHMRQNIGYLPLGGVAQFGHAGVDFFFVLSGFIIYYVHGKDMNNHRRLLNYVERRFTRIYPLYWFVIIFALMLDLMFAKSLKSDILTIVGSATLFPTLRDPYIGVAWTLQHEVIFYSIFAIGIVNYRLGWSVFSVWLMAIIVNWGFVDVNPQNGLMHKILSFYSLEFFFGIFAAWVTLKMQKSSKLNLDRSENNRSEYTKYKLLLMIGMLIFLTFGIAENKDMYEINSIYARLGYGLSSMMMVIGLAGLREVKNRKVSEILGVLGSASFSIYLTHLIFIGITYKIFEMTGLFASLYVWVTYLLLSFSGIFGGIIISKFIEHPLTDLTRIYISRVKLLTREIP